MIEKMKVNPDQVRGCLFGGAVGDALGYPVEFMRENSIFNEYGKDGIQAYALDPGFGKALISDDTQMALFTAVGMLYGDAAREAGGDHFLPRVYVQRAYEDWLYTQENPFARLDGHRKITDRVSWLLDVPEFYSRRAPGITCLNALTAERRGRNLPEDYIREPQNNSKGCGGIMRVAPAGLDPRMAAYFGGDIAKMDYEAAEFAAITHGHSLGYMTAAVLAHIIARLVFGNDDGTKPTLSAAVQDAKETVDQIFSGDPHLAEMDDIIDLAVSLSQNDAADLDNIHRLGEGWVAEETLGISLYCALRYQNDFSAGVIASVNHKGDSDSTGAVTGNILGALLGYNAIEEKWKQNLELADVILEVADDLAAVDEAPKANPAWMEKYIHARRPQVR